MTKKHKPCNDCPFRRDLPQPFPLRRGRRESIAQSLLNDAAFGCHKTTSSNEDGEYVYTDRERPCIGAALLIERELGDCRANFMFRLQVWSGKLDPEAIDRSIPVLDTVEAFVNAEEDDSCS